MASRGASTIFTTGPLTPKTGYGGFFTRIFSPLGPKDQRAIAFTLRPSSVVVVDGIVFTCVVRRAGLGLARLRPSVRPSDTSFAARYIDPQIT